MIKCYFLFITFLLSSCMTMPLKERGLLPGIKAAQLDLLDARTMHPKLTFNEHRIASGSETLYAISATRADATLTVLFFGGNQYTINKWAENTLNYYQNIAVNVVLVDHCGYGASTGRASLACMFDGAESAYLTIKEWPELRALPVIVHGHSIGSFLAGHVAENHTLAGLILEGSATTTEEWISVYPKRLSGFFVRKFDIDPALQHRGNLSLMDNLDEPILIVVGEQDTQTPPLLSKKLFKAIKGNLPRQLLIVPNCSHLDAAWGNEFRQSFMEIF